MLIGPIPLENTLRMRVNFCDEEERARRCLLMTFGGERFWIQAVIAAILLNDNNMTTTTITKIEYIRPSLQRTKGRRIASDFLRPNDTDSLPISFTNLLMHSPAIYCIMELYDSHFRPIKKLF